MKDHDNIIYEFTMNYGKANFYAFLLIIPVSMLFILPFILIWDIYRLIKGLDIILDHIVLIIFGGIILHELLHGITWSFFTKNRLKSIKYGFQWKYLTPYCHCTEPLKMYQYRLGTVMPLLVLGIIPFILGIILGNGLFACAGIFFSWAAGGDIISLYQLKNLNRNFIIDDHPEKMGFYVISLQNKISNKQ